MANEFVNNVYSISCREICSFNEMMMMMPTLYYTKYTSEKTEEALKYGQFIDTINIGQAKQKHK